MRFGVYPRNQKQIEALTYFHEAVSGQSWEGISRRSGFVLGSLLWGISAGFGPPGGKWRESDPQVAVYQRALPTRGGSNRERRFPAQVMSP